MTGGLWQLNANAQILKDILIAYRVAHDIWSGLGQHIQLICTIETISNVRTVNIGHSSLTYSYAPGCGKRNICYMIVLLNPSFKRRNWARSLAANLNIVIIMLELVMFNPHKLVHMQR